MEHYNLDAILAGAGLLSWQGQASFRWSELLIAGACLCWGVDNNLTRKLSSADPVQIAMLKGLVAGSVNLALALWQGGAAFFFRQLVDENLRTATGEYGRPQPIYYFVPVLFYNMAPWSLFFPALALFLYRQRDRLKKDEFLYPLIWLTVAFVFFSLSSGKRGIYILSLYPAAALLWGAWWDHVEKGDSQSQDLTLFIGYFV